MGQSRAYPSVYPRIYTWMLKHRNSLSKANVSPCKSLSIISIQRAIWCITWCWQNQEGLHGIGDTWASMGRRQSAKIAKYGRDRQKSGEETPFAMKGREPVRLKCWVCQGSSTADKGQALFSREWGPFNVTRNTRCAWKGLLHYPETSQMDWMRPRLEAESIMRLSQ